MSSFKSIQGNLQHLHIEQVHVRNQLQFNEDSYSIHHTLDPDTGKYEIKNNITGAKLIGFNHDSTLRSDSALYNHVENKVNPMITVVTSHTTTIADHEDRMTAVEGVVDPDYTMFGTSSSNTPFIAGSVPIETNKIGRIKGDVKTKTSHIEFDVYCKNQAGTASILSWNKESNYLGGGSEDITFSAISSGIRFTLTNGSSSTNWRIVYNTDFIDL